VKVDVRGRLAGGGDFAEAHERRPGSAVALGAMRSKMMRPATTWLVTTTLKTVASTEAVLNRVHPYVARERSRVARRSMVETEPRLEGEVPGGEKAVYARHRGETRGEERDGRRSSRAAAA
jgi:hypothetical protein